MPERYFTVPGQGAQLEFETSWCLKRVEGFFKSPYAKIWLIKRNDDHFLYRISFLYSPLTGLSGRDLSISDLYGVNVRD